MIFPYPTEWPQYFTASIRNWMPLLAADKYKNIISDSLHFMVENKRIEMNAFVVMNNHIHLIWQPLPGHTLSSIQLSFMKFTAQQIKFALAVDNPVLLEQCKVNKTDREYQIWKRKPLRIELSSEKVFLQKMEYIHYNPVKAGICAYPEDYHFSSAMFYEKGIYHFKMLTNYMVN
jgi:REP element-mobilizing transposase RayT